MKRIFPFMVLLSILLISCSQSKPEIQSSNIQLLRIQGPAGSFAERLSVFVLFTDADGTADFSSIRLTHPESGLFWDMPAEGCMTRLRGKDLWTGSNNIAGPGDRPLPAGTYTVSVFDLAGNEAAASFTLVRPTFPEYAPVTFNIDGDFWTLIRNTAPTGFARSWLFLYDEQLNLVYSWRVPDSESGRAEGSVAELRAHAQTAVSVQCYTENADGSAGVLLTPVNME